MATITIDKHGVDKVTLSDGRVIDIKEFREVYARMADEGKCDGIGGTQYIRVLTEWIVHRTGILADFIHWRSNISAQEDTPLGSRSLYLPDDKVITALYEQVENFDSEKLQKRIAELMGADSNPEDD